MSSSSNQQLQIDYGTLGLESHILKQTDVKTKGKQPVFTRTQTCQNVTRVAIRQNISKKQPVQGNSIQHGFSKRKNIKTQPDEQPSAQLISWFAVRLKEIVQAQQDNQKTFKRQITILNEKAHNAKLKNIMLEFETQIIKRHLGETNKLIKQLDERLSKAQFKQESRQIANRAYVRDSIETKQQISLPKSFRQPGHYRFKSAGFDKLSLKRHGC